MPRTLSAGMTTHLAGAVQTRAVCVKITRRDTVVQGFTSHDRDLTVSGVTYQALTNAHASEVRATEGAGVDNLDVVGIITSTQVKDVDLLAGVYDGAEVELFEVVWSDLSLGTIPHLSGIIGEITRREGEWIAEIRSLSQRLGQGVGAISSPLCRVRALGDAECLPPGSPLNGFTLASVQFTRTVSSVTSAKVIVFGSDSNASTYYRYGRVRFTTGLNANIEREVKEHALSAGTAIITLQEAFPFTVSPGDSALLEAGCDRTVSQCQSRFNNVANFQAEPHVPGNFLILRTGSRANTGLFNLIRETG